jgi:hypothetical protein
LCIGYNGLYQLPKPATATDGESSDEDEISQERAGKENNYPDGKRQWVWLVLCDDG